MIDDFGNEFEYHGPERRQGVEASVVVPLRTYMEAQLKNVHRELSAADNSLRTEFTQFYSTYVERHAELVHKVSDLEVELANLKTDELREKVGEEARSATYKQLVGAILTINVFVGGVVTLVFILIDRI